MICEQTGKVWTRRSFGMDYAKDRAKTTRHTINTRIKANTMNISNPFMNAMTCQANDRMHQRDCVRSKHVDTSSRQATSGIDGFGRRDDTRFHVALARIREARCIDVIERATDAIIFAHVRCDPRRVFHVRVSEFCAQCRANLFVVARECCVVAMRVRNDRFQHAWENNRFRVGLTCHVAFRFRVRRCVIASTIININERDRMSNANNAIVHALNARNYAHHKLWFGQTIPIHIRRDWLGHTIPPKAYPYYTDSNNSWTH